MAERPASTEEILLLEHLGGVGSGGRQLTRLEGGLAFAKAVKISAPGWRILLEASWVDTTTSVPVKWVELRHRVASVHIAQLIVGNSAAWLVEWTPVEEAKVHVLIRAPTWLAQ